MRVFVDTAGVWGAKVIGAAHNSDPMCSILLCADAVHVT
jgi:hypothetical protein